MGSMYFMEGLPVRGEPPPASDHAASAIGSGSGSARGSRLCARVTVSPSDRRQLRSLLTGRFAPAAQLTSAPIDDQETGRQELQRFLHLPEGRLFEEVAGERGGEVETGRGDRHRSEEHTTELQSLMSTSYTVFCLK